MARVKTFDLNVEQGVFRVFATDGSVVFDSRFPAQRTHMTSVATATGRTMQPDGHGGYVLVMSTPTYVPFNKIFAKQPYVLSASRPLDDKDPTGFFKSDRITCPGTIVGRGGPYYSSYAGYLTNAGLSGMNIGNLNFNDGPSDGSFGGSNGLRRVWYSVFENGIS